MSFSDMIKILRSHKSNLKTTRKTLQVPVSNKTANKDISADNSDIPKRMSPAFLHFTDGSMTVEAALALPVFIFFMVNILSLISVFDLYSVKLSRAQQNARAGSYMCCSLTDAGADTVTMVEYVPIRPYVASIGYSPSATLASMTYRKWTGYNVLSGAGEVLEDEYVYITEHGYSYHRSRNCSHLKVTIRAVSSEVIDSLRNSSGSRYHPCERCGGSGTGILFVTPDGDRYHSDAGCSSLKRNIRTVRLSEVGGRTPCSECCR